jgi:hypothetical protein
VLILIFLSIPVHVSYSYGHNAFVIFLRWKEKPSRSLFSGISSVHGIVCIGTPDIARKSWPMKNMQDFMAVAIWSGVDPVKGPSIG